MVDTRNIFESFEERDLDFFFAFLMENSVMVITLGISFILIQKLSLFRLGLALEGFFPGHFCDDTSESFSLFSVPSVPQETHSYSCGWEGLT